VHAEMVLAATAALAAQNDLGAVYNCVIVSASCCFVAHRYYLHTVEQI
jgi:hypothetical protein